VEAKAFSRRKIKVLGLNYLSTKEMKMSTREKEGKWTKEELLKRLSWNSFEYAGRAILKVKASLEKIRVFGHYNFDEISKKLGPFEIEESPISDKKTNNYDTKVIRGIKDFPDINLSVLVNHKKRFSPQSSIEIHPENDISSETHKAFLVWLGERLPGLNVSKVEYAIDQFCVDHVGARIIFWVNRRCLHIVHRRMGRLFGDDKNNAEHVKSLTYKAGRYHKIYEKGPSTKKHGQSWFLEDVDRVRLVHKVNRTKLKKYGISSLEDLIKNPRFSVLNIQRWRFMQFLKLRKLPRFWKPRAVKDQGSCSGYFKLEAIRSRRKAENISEHITSYKELVRIESKINDAMKLFDMEWYNH